MRRLLQPSSSLRPGIGETRLPHLRLTLSRRSHSVHHTRFRRLLRRPRRGGLPSPLLLRTACLGCCHRHLHLVCVLLCQGGPLLLDSSSDGGLCITVCSGAGIGQCLCASGVDGGGELLCVRGLG